MTKKEKRIRKAIINKKNVTFETLDTILTNNNFERRQPKSGSSHYIYTKDEIVITIPRKKPYIYSSHSGLQFIIPRNSRCGTWLNKPTSGAILSEAGIKEVYVKRVLELIGAKL